MPQIPGRIFEIVQQLKENKQPRRATVRKVLKWFNSTRRGVNVVAEIEHTLEIAGLRTEPPFAAADIDQPLRFILYSSNATEVTAHDPPPSSSEPNGRGDQSEISTRQPIANGVETSPDFLEPDIDEMPTPVKWTRDLSRANRTTGPYQYFVTNGNATNWISNQHTSVNTCGD